MNDVIELKITWLRLRNERERNSKRYIAEAKGEIVPFDPFCSSSALFDVIQGPSHRDVRNAFDAYAKARRIANGGTSRKIYSIGVPAGLPA